MFCFLCGAKIEKGQLFLDCENHEPSCPILVNVKKGIEAVLLKVKGDSYIKEE